jgi:hypothetical protein
VVVAIIYYLLVEVAPVPSLSAARRKRFRTATLPQPSIRGFLWAAPRNVWVRPTPERESRLSYRPGELSKTSVCYAPDPGNDVRHSMPESQAVASFATPGGLS